MAHLLIGILVIAPVIAIALNVAIQFIPRKASEPPTVFYWLPFILGPPSRTYGNVFTFILFGRRVTVALGPQGNNFVLGGKATVFNAEDAYKHLTTPVFGREVNYDVPNGVFMEQKKFVKLGLSTENLKAYVGMIEEEVIDFLNNDPTFKSYQENDDKGSWGSFDVVKFMQEVTILTASRTLQGKEVRAGLDRSFAETYNDLDNGFTPLNFFFPNLPLPSYKRRDRAQARMSNFYRKIVKERRDGNQEHEHDMIAALMQQKYRSGRFLNDTEIAHMMITLLMAGQHTSSASGSWALLHLAANAEVADALYQEQVKYFTGPDGKLRPLTHEELRSLPLLDAVIRETLRMHPPIHSIMRYVRDDVPVPASLAAPSENGIYIVPKGNYVLASPAVSQTDPTVWKNVDTWDPYRWNDKDGVAAQAFKMYVDESGEKIDYGFGAVSKGTESPYQPFGSGRHRCIGEQFAYLQLGTLIVTLVRALELRIEQVPKHNYHTMITMPKTPRTISYRKRDQSRLL